MPQGYIKEATYQFSSLYPPGKCFISWVLQSVIQVSSLESKRMLVVPERSFGGFDIMDASRVHQGSCISIFILLPFWEMLHLLCVSRASSWSPRGRWRFLRGVLVVFDMMDDPRIHQGSCISIFIRLPTWEVLQLLGEWGGNKT